MPPPNKTLGSQSKPLYPAEIDYLLPAVLKRNLCTEEDVQMLQPVALSADVSIIGILFLQGKLTSMDIADIQAEHFGLKSIDLNEIGTIDPRIITLFQGYVTREYCVIPIDAYENTIVLATAHPEDLNALDTLLHVSRKNHELRVAAPEAISLALKRYYPESILCAT